MDTVHSIDLITTNPAVRGGRPCIAGTTLEVAVIAIERVLRESSPEQIAADYRLSLAEVHAALSYYYAHRAEIDDSIRQREHEAEALKQELIARGHTPLLGRKSEPKDR